MGAEIQPSIGAWRLLEKDYTLRLSLVAHEWATEHLRAWNRVFAEGRRRGNAGYFGPALVEMEVADADKRAEWAYRTCCEIWEIQGRKKSRPFFRAVFESCLQPMFSVRESCFKHELSLHQKRTATRIAQNQSAILGSLKREMSRLRARWNTILEIATRESENQERLEREQELKQSAHAIGDQRISLQPSGPILPSSPSEVRPHGGEEPWPFSWRELEIRFKEIQAKTSPHQSFYAWVVTTEWDTGSISEEWTVGGDVALRNEFESIASIAAQKLGYPPRDGAHKNWLGRVREWMRQTGLDNVSYYAWRPSGNVSQGGMVGETRSLHSVNIAELSAMFCVSLMARQVPESPAVPQSPVNSEASQRRIQPSRTARTVLKTKKELNRMAVIFGAIQAGYKGEKYCSALDNRKVPLPEHWIEEGCPNTYLRAYKDEHWRHRIQDEKSRFKERYEGIAVKEREAIIRGETGTRRTRH